jgi:hypothetical protein
LATSADVRIGHADQGRLLTDDRDELVDDADRSTGPGGKWISARERMLESRRRIVAMPEIPQDTCADVALIDRVVKRDQHAIAELYDVTAVCCSVSF